MKLITKALYLLLGFLVVASSSFKVNHNKEKNNNKLIINSKKTKILSFDNYGPPHKATFNQYSSTTDKLDIIGKDKLSAKELEIKVIFENRVESESSHIPNLCFNINLGRKEISRI